MQILDVIQGSPEWLNARRAQITASRIADVVSFRKDGKESADRRKLKLEFLQELIKGRSVDHYVTPAMERGIELEPMARYEYETRYGVEVTPIGYIVHPTLDRCGASPDGWIEPDAFIEIKVPTPGVHLEYLISGEVPADYIPQMQWQMACAGPDITHCWFVSFDPDNPPELQLFVRRVERDEKKIAYLEEQATIFLEEVVQMFERVKIGKPSLTQQLERSLEARKAFRKMENDALMEQLRDEGISVP